MPEGPHARRRRCRGHVASSGSVLVPPARCGDSGEVKGGEGMW